MTETLPCASQCWHADLLGIAKIIVERIKVPARLLQPHLNQHCLEVVHGVFVPLRLQCCHWNARACALVYKFLEMLSKFVPASNNKNWRKLNYAHKIDSGKVVDLYMYLSFNGIFQTFSIATKDLQYSFSASASCLVDDRLHTLVPVILDQGLHLYSQVITTNATFCTIRTDGHKPQKLLH